MICGQTNLAQFYFCAMSRRNRMRRMIHWWYRKKAANRSQRASRVVDAGSWEEAKWVMPGSRIHNMGIGRARSEANDIQRYTHIYIYTYIRGHMMEQALGLSSLKKAVGPSVAAGVAKWW